MKKPSRNDTKFPHLFGNSYHCEMKLIIALLLCLTRLKNLQNAWTIKRKIPTANVALCGKKPNAAFSNTYSDNSIVLRRSKVRLLKIKQANGRRRHLVPRMNMRRLTLGTHTHKQAANCRLVQPHDSASPILRTSPHVIAAVHRPVIDYYKARY